MRDKISLTKTSREVKEILKKDRRLNKLIKLIGEIEIPLKKDYFASLVESIIGQQLSVKVASTIKSRVMSLCGELSPHRILELSEEELRSVGLSRGKVLYLKDLAHHVNEGRLELNSLDMQKDEEIICRLTAVKGIGRWTAEMFLIFSLGRPDVFSCGDLGLKRAISWLYQMEEVPLSFLKECYSNWSPHGTVASLYLWEAINRGYVGEYSSIDEVK